jgi:hypothetical protein
MTVKFRVMDFPGNTVPVTGTLLTGREIRPNRLRESWYPGPHVEVPVLVIIAEAGDDAPLRRDPGTTRVRDALSKVVGPGGTTTIVCAGETARICPALLVTAKTRRYVPGVVGAFTAKLLTVLLPGITGIAVVPSDADCGCQTIAPLPGVMAIV